MSLLTPQRVLLSICAVALLTAFVFQRPGLKQKLTGSYSAKDFSSLKWVEGKWKGTGGGQPFFEQYQFVNDSLMEILYYPDSTFKNESGRGTVYLSGGQIFHRNGKLQWQVNKLNAKSVSFEPKAGATNAFMWAKESDELWNAVMVTPGSAKPGKTYRMQRVR
jgi:hypothetical protein